MSNQLRRPLPDHAPAERLARAIREIDRQIEQTRLAREPALLSAYRARGILRKAHARCKALAETHIPQAPCQPAVRPDVLPKPHRSRRDPVECNEALPGPHPPRLVWQDVGYAREPAAATGPCDRTGKSIPNRSRLILAAGLLLGLIAALSIWSAIAI